MSTRAGTVYNPMEELDRNRNSSRGPLEEPQGEPSTTRVEGGGVQGGVAAYQGGGAATISVSNDGNVS